MSSDCLRRGAVRPLFVAGAAVRRPRGVVARRHVAMSASSAPSSWPPQALLVVGCGRLGRRLAQLWSAQHGAEALVGCETRTDASHGELEALGVRPLRTRAERTPGERFPNVAITFSPAGNDDYAAEVAEAVKLWAGAAENGGNGGGGTLVFTSSSGVYADSDDGVVVDERSPTRAADDASRAGAIVRAERAVLGAGGCVVRLSGLYDRNVGAHNFWLRKDEVDSRADGLINLIHYDDAASLLSAALNADASLTRSTVFLGNDDAPLTRRAICEAARGCRDYADMAVPTFKRVDGPTGRRFAEIGKNLRGLNFRNVHDNSRTRELLHWRPKNETFADYMAAQQ